MNAVPSFVFLFAALGCSLVGRALLAGAAFGVGTGWGISVLFVPFAPLFFRLSYPDFARRARYWRLATVPLMLLFFITGGSPSMSGLRLTHPHKVLPAAVVARASVPPEQTPDAEAPAPVNEQIVGQTDSPAAASETAAVKPAEEAPAPLPVPMAAERQEANRRQFEVLAEWYARLKSERGYLLKSDTAGIASYNVEAVKYQAALQQAKVEQAELAKLLARK